MKVATIALGNTVELKPITLGRNLGTDVEVIKGLKLSDRLVNSPSDSLSTGDKVHIAKQSPSGGGADGQTSNAGGEDVAATPPKDKSH